MADTAHIADQTQPSAPPTGEAGVGDYLALLKPRVMSLVIFTGLVGMVVAPGSIHPVIGLTALLCIAVGAGASGALNMWYDADIDAVMIRTCDRPIPRGRIEPGEALGFGATLSVASVLLMGLAVNLVAAGLLAFTIAFYVFVYTMWLKRRTPQNIVIGGAAGALPPVVAWSAVTGTLGIEPLVLFAIIFLWTPPHFWALALYRSGDYRNAGIPMLPVIAGADETRRQMLIYSLLLVPATLAPWLLGFAGLGYGVVAAGLSGLFLLGAVRVWREKSDRAARRLFGFSILFLFGIFAALLIEHGVRALL